MPDGEQLTRKSPIAEREERILAFWRQDDTFRKSLQKKSPKGEFVFYDGPPFATGLPHYGHILAGTIKDVIPRFKTMQGFHVPRRFGWDCHGLPVETELEKELGFKSKRDIERYGIGKFNERARELVTRYTADWRRIIPRLGRWVDMDNDYRTMDAAYTESVWWAFKILFKRGLIYEGFKAMQLCPRCGTTLSNFEVSQGYKKVTDISVYAKFPLVGLPNTYAVAWTTTPWTLPGNTALAVSPELEYAAVEITASNAPDVPAGDRFVMGAREEILRRVFGGEGFEFDRESRVGSFRRDGAAVSFSAAKGVLGKELVGQSYEPPFPEYARQDGLANRDRGWKVYPAAFVTAAEGTGIVHIAPAFGEDDYELARKEKLPFIQHVGADGVFKSELPELSGLAAKPKGNPRETDERVAALLAARGRLLKAEPIEHDYPHCWRCETPLLNFAAPSWFLQVSALRNKLVAENQGIKWVPPEAGRFRFGNWLSQARDWAVSRSRYFGAPVPVWRCERCRRMRVVGSFDEIRADGRLLVKLLFLRHGESQKNRREVFDDSPKGFGLTRAGRREAKRAAKRIAAQGGVDFVFSSPVRRARETAAIIGRGLGKTAAVDERLREVDSGEWDGRKTDDPSIAPSRAAYAGLSPEEYYRARRGGTGESWEDVEKRLKDFLSEIIGEHKGKSVLIVSHEGPIIYALKALENLTLEEADRGFRQERFEEYSEPLTVYADAANGKEFDPHRPTIDEIPLSCPYCAEETGAGRGLMRRVSGVLDCWFESGAMPFASAHYPFERDGRFAPVGSLFRRPKGFPANFIAEGLDQTRGWFYSLLVLSAALFGKAPYRAVVVNGIILAEDGGKMSKRLKNYPDPLELVSRYGADALRYHLLSSPAVRGQELRFSERGVDEAAKKVFNRLDNALAFYLLYAPAVKDKGLRLKDTSNVLDRWVIARLRQLIGEVTRALEQYELDKAIRPVGAFIEDLSIWYLRRSRERIKSDVLEEKEAALFTLRHALRELSKVMAPFAPFYAEHLYQELTAGRQHAGSVHLESWPEAPKLSAADLRLLSDMALVRRIVSLGLEARAKAKIKVRQPLSALRVRNHEAITQNHKYISLIKDELNVKEIVADPALQTEAELNTTITPELKEEGLARELIRFVQDMRKRRGFKPGEPAVLAVSAGGPSRRFVEQHERELSRAAALTGIRIEDAPSEGEALQLDGLSLSLSLRRA